MDPRIKTVILNRPSLPRLLLSDQTAMNEKEFTSVVLRVLNRLYASCHVIRFSPVVMNDGVPWRPDLAVIDRGLGYWFVIEVEIATHSLEKHIVPQVVGLRDGTYDMGAVELISRATGLPIDNVATFVKYVPRYVAVVSNVEDEQWNRKLRENNIQFISIAEFSREDAAGAYLVTGLLQPAERSLGIGQVLANQQVIKLAANEYWRDGDYKIVDEKGASMWRCQIQDRVAWLYKRHGLIHQQDRMWVQFVAHEDDLRSVRAL